eukprot:jgi/Pico_ML_1/55854/g1484.t1
MAGWTEALSERVEFTFVDAPHERQGTVPEEVKRNFAGPYYQWWDASADGSIYHGAHVSFAHLRDVMMNQGPFDGLMGFSQEDFQLLQDEEGVARIEGYSEEGFLINSVEVEGSVICYQNLFLMWNVNEWKEVTPDTLALVEAVKPAPELLLLGSGRTYQHPPPALLKWLSEKRLPYEVMDTAHAVSTYNVLAQEGRRVVLAVLTVNS